MRSMRTAIAISTLALGLSSAGTQAATLADWTFETSLPTTAGPFAAEIGSGSASGSHAAASTYSNPAGNGSQHSFSSTAWAVGDYYQFSVSSLGYKDLSLSWDQTSSGTGPRDFTLAYSTNGSTFTNFADYSVLLNGSPNPAWNMATSSSLFTFTKDLSSISALNNQSTLYFRLIDKDTTSANGGTVAAGGTDRVDNFIVSGVIPTPLPAAAWLFGSGLTMLAGFRRKRRTA